MEKVDPAVAVAETQYCEGCPLKGSEYVVGYGYSDSPVMVIGSAPGPVEELTGIAFTSEQGALLREMLDALGIEAYYTNVLKRRPKDAEGKNRKPNKKECWKCGSHLVLELLRNRPALILTLGHVPLQFIVGSSAPDLPTVHGLPLKMTKYAMDFQVVPTFDLGWVARQGGINSKAGDEWWNDIEDFARLAARV